MEPRLTVPGFELPASILSVLPLPAFVRNREGRYVACNASFLGMMGVSAEWLLDATAGEVSKHVHAAALAREDERLLDAPGTVRYTTRLEQADGSRREVEVAKSTLVGADGAPQGIVGVVCDRTDPAARAARLGALESAVTQMADAFVITDEKNSIVYVNPAFERLTGYPAAEAVGNNPRVLKSGFQHPWFYQEMWGKLTRGEPWRGRLVNRRKDGRDYLEEMTITPLIGPGGRVIGYTAVKRDVTGEAAEEVRRVAIEREALLGQLVAEIAHDFRNLLVGILGNVELSLARTGGAEADGERLRRIEAAGRKGLELTSRIVSFVRGDHPAAELYRLTRLLEEAGELMRILFPPTIACRIVPDGMDGYLRVDRLEFQQVVLNLASNARDALRGRPGIVSLTAVPVHGETGRRPEVEIQFADSGPGMSRDVLDRIFEPTFSTGEPTSHFGMGLGTVRRLMEKMEGSVSVDSEPGRGAVFRLRFPLQPSPSEASG